jgi:two-component system OmpR family sensor kinase
MIYHTLYSRLAITLFVLLCFVGLGLNQLIRHSSSMYQQEVSQKLNADLAQHIASEESLFKNNGVDEEALEQLFHQLMVVNPGIEVYLLDRQGKVLEYLAPDTSIKRRQVDLEPIREFLTRSGRLPIMGDDPRSLDHSKIFSAAEIIDQNELKGYLYIVIEGEKFDDIVAMLHDSYIMDSALVVLFSALAAALVCGLLVFSFLTRRLRNLGSEVRSYASNSDHQQGEFGHPLIVDSNDEIGQLRHHFYAMAERIDAQFKEVRQMDGMRRELVANVSHDLRTPLTTMRGYLETLLIKNGELSQAEEKQYLETALLHSERLGRLVDELFELARLDSCETVVYSEPFSMGELVQDVAQAFELRAQQNSISLELKINPATPLIYGDIAMMQRVLENLLENGLRHTQQGGRIHIAVQVESTNVTVQIADNGCGIPDEDVPRIFERFYQPKDSNRENSTGLGLAIVKRILELHGSVIKVRSQMNQGTTFSFTMASNSSP